MEEASNRLLYLQPQRERLRERDRGFSIAIAAPPPPNYLLLLLATAGPGRADPLSSHMTLQELGFSSSKMRYDESCIGDACIPGGP